MNLGFNIKKISAKQTTINQKNLKKVNHNHDLYL